MAGTDGRMDEWVWIDGWMATIFAFFYFSVKTRLDISMLSPSKAKTKMNTSSPAGCGV